MHVSFRNERTQRTYKLVDGKIVLVSITWEG